jgi:hypothetical protein
MYGNSWAREVSDYTADEQTNLKGLAHIKTRHVPYNFHPVFESYTVRMLEYSSHRIIKYMKGIRRIEKKQKSLVSRQRYSGQLSKLYKKLGPALLFHCTARLPLIALCPVPPMRLSRYQCADFATTLTH